MSKVLQNNKSSPTIYTPIHYISNDTIIRICHSFCIIILMVKIICKMDPDDDSQCYHKAFSNLLIQLSDHNITMGVVYLSDI